MKIVFFGDSLTQGTLGASYVDKVAAAMRGHQFINQGVNGDTSLNLYRRVHRDVITEQPDGVFIMIGVNDAISAVEPGSQLYFRFIKQVRGGRISPLAFRENMRSLLTRLSMARIPTWVALPPIEYNPEQVRILREMNAYNAEICRELEIPTLDLMSRLTPPDIRSRPPYGLLHHGTNFLRSRGLIKTDEKRRLEDGFTFSFDGVHLTEMGAQQMADLIVPFLREHGVT